ncbi:MAG: hypothetical protein IKC32_06250 [Clostridia bacterium]|nr:hypothetical protein [Clostridia bacterium]
MTKRIHSFVWSGIVAAVLLTVGIVTSVNASDFGLLPLWIAVAACSFTLISCLILGGNFVGDMMAEIFSWGFVKMPGLIFTLDLDGIVWLLTVKLLFWILGIILAVICGLLAIAIGLVVSVFVYPYALVKNIRNSASSATSAANEGAKLY